MKELLKDFNKNVSTIDKIAVIMWIVAIAIGAFYPLAQHLVFAFVSGVGVGNILGKWFYDHLQD